MQFGVDGLVQIEEKRLKFVNDPLIQSLNEVEQREVIITSYQNAKNNSEELKDVNKYNQKGEIGTYTLNKRSKRIFL